MTTTRLAVARGLVSGQRARISVLGDAVEALRVHDWRRASTRHLTRGCFPVPCACWFACHAAEPATTSPTPRTRQGLPRPGAGLGVEAARGQAPCDRAMHCLRVLRQALPGQCDRDREWRARMDGSTCIRCYCCHELCPQTPSSCTNPCWAGCCPPNERAPGTSPTPAQIRSLTMRRGRCVGFRSFTISCTVP